jgi:large subunit ribosomal protein L5
MAETKTTENPMRRIEIASLTLHCSTADQVKLARATKLLQFISDAKPIMTLARKRIPTWKVRPGMQIGCKVTLRGQRAIETLKRLLVGVPTLSEKQFNPGFMNFGIKEYIEIPSIPYQRDIGIMGFEAIATLKRPGFNISRRKRFRSKIGSAHKITKDETIEFFKKNFEIKLEQ